jgi:ornithine cyclodeaminase
MSNSRKVEFLYLQQEDCIKAGGLDMSGTLKATERSFFLHGKGDYILPAKPVIRWGGEDSEETIGRIMSMPSWIGGESYKDELLAKGLLGPVNTSGIKFIPSKPHNPAKYNLPRANAIIIILDPETLMPICIMDGTLVSAMRTGAASGVAAKYLANPGAKVMGLIGSGVQGRTQLMGVSAAIPSLEVCKIYSPNPEHVQKIVDEMQDKVDVEVVAAKSYEEAISGSDIICTATMAKAPYVNPDWWKKGALHVETSFWDTPPSALKEVDIIVVDDWFQVKHHGADVAWRAVRDGFITEDAIRGNLGDIIVGKTPGRKDEKERIVFNPIGMGIHDLSEAYRVYTNAKKEGIGRTLPLWENPVLCG